MRIDLEDVSFGYSRNRDVISGITMSLDGPGLYCILGPNGVGKSTLVKCINRLLTPTSGRILIDGRDTAEMTTKEISLRISYVPASSPGSFSMPVIDSILLGRHNHQGWRTSERDLEVVHKVMDMLDLNGLAMSDTDRLSAGQYQKVSIARGIVQESDIMILDEPTSNLDVKHQMYVAELLGALAEINGKMIIMISHDLNIASMFSKELIMLAEPGVLYRIGDSETVLTAETIRDVYGVSCQVIEHRGKPHVILDHAIEL